MTSRRKSIAQEEGPPLNPCGNLSPEEREIALMQMRIALSNLRRRLDAPEPGDPFVDWVREQVYSAHSSDDKAEDDQDRT